MPFVKKSGKKKAAPAPLDARRIFIGREQELRFLREHLLDPEEPDYNLISLYGQGGVGKTTLLSRLEGDIRTTSKYKDSCLTARVNERHLTPTSVMEAFADQLDLKGEFEKALGHYKEALHKLYDEREQERETFGRKATMTLAGSVAKSVPVPGVNDLLSQGAEQVSGLILDEVLSRQRLKAARRLENPLQDLTDRFITELNKLAERQGSGNRPIRRILLCFDTFEQLTAEIAPWLLDYFLPEEINENVVLVVAGRHELSHSTPDDPKRWQEYEHILYEIELKTFSREETTLYLVQRGVTEATRVNQIWQLSHGLPLYLGMLTANQNGKLDPTADVVQNFLLWIPAGEEVKQRLVLDAALFSRAFNRDDLKAFAYVGEDQRAELYDWLRLQSFVVRDIDSGRYSYHDITQKMFSRHLYSISPEDCRETRTFLAAHYQKALAAVEASEGEHAAEVEEWLELTLALIQQLLLLPDEEKLIQAVGLVVRAIGAEWETSRSEKVGNVLQRLLDGLGQQMTERARRLVKRLLSYQSQIIEQPEWYEAVQEFIQKMLPSSQRFLEALVLLYFVRARAYREQEKYEKALRDFQHALELNPQYTRAWYSQGAMLGKLKRHEEALAAYDQAIKLKPDYVAAWSNKGDMLDALERYEEALVAYDQAIKLNPQYARAWYNKGITLWKRERYKEALVAYEEAIQLNSHYADAWYNKEIVLGRLGRNEDALAAYEEALAATTFDLASAVGWYNKGDMLVALKRLEEALAAYDQAMKLNPYYADAWLNKGIVLWKLERYEEVLMYLNRALEIDPQHSDAWINKGDFLHGFERDEEALACYDKALAINPENSTILSSKGAALSSLERDEEALACYDKALAINPENSTTWNNKGYSLIALKQFEEAIKCLDKALAISPRDPRPWRHKGNALCELHQYEEALVCLNEALGLDAYYVGALYNKGAVLRRLKQYEEALAAYNQALTYDITVRLNSAYAKYYEEALVAYDGALQITPQDIDSWGNKGILLYKLGRDKEARATFDEAIRLNTQYTEFLEKTLSDCEEAIKQNPHYALAWFYKGMNLWKLRREEEAQASFAESVKWSPQKRYGGTYISRFERYIDPEIVEDEYLDMEIVIFLQGRWGSNVSTYFYVAVTGHSLKKLFTKMRAGERWHPADFGRVLATGIGDPPEELREEMRLKYNMTEAPVPRTEPGLQPKSFDDENIEG